MVSRAADRSRRQRHDTCCEPMKDGIGEMIMNAQESSFSRVVFTVSRLVGIEKIIR